MKGHQGKNERNNPTTFQLSNIYQETQVFNCLIIHIYQ